jgi:hypothetical protein
MNTFQDCMNRRFLSLALEMIVLEHIAQCDLNVILCILSLTVF